MTHAGNEFHRVRIENRDFVGTVTNGGVYIEQVETPRGSVVLGPATIRLLKPDRHLVKTEHWAVVKYSHEERIDLSGISLEGVKALSVEFGLLMLGYESPMRSQKHFFNSPAFSGLCAWAKAHPRLFKTYSGGTEYLDWPRRVAESLRQTA